MPKMGNNKKTKLQGNKRKSDGSDQAVTDDNSKRKRGQSSLGQPLPLEHNQNKATRSSGKIPDTRSPVGKRGTRKIVPSKTSNIKSPKRRTQNSVSTPKSRQRSSHESENSLGAFEQFDNQQNEEANTVNNGVDVMINPSDDEFAEEEMNQRGAKTPTKGKADETPSRQRNRSESRSRPTPVQDDTMEDNSPPSQGTPQSGTSGTNTVTFKNGNYEKYRQAYQKDPQFQAFLNEMVSQRIEDNEVERRYEHQYNAERQIAKQRKPGIYRKVIPSTQLSPVIKSPSDSTLYTPALKKGKVDNQIINRISNFVDNIRLETQRDQDEEVRNQEQMEQDRPNRRSAS